MTAKRQTYAATCEVLSKKDNPYGRLFRNWPFQTVLEDLLRIRKMALQNRWIKFYQNLSIEKLK